MNGALIGGAVLVALLLGSFVSHAREIYGRAAPRSILDSSDLALALSSAAKQYRHKGVRALGISSVLLIALFVIVLFALLAIAAANTIRGGK